MVFKENVKRFGFGCMRLPQKQDHTIDTEQLNKMVDLFIEKGFTYFDTAHGYHGGLSEKAVKTCLTDRYDHSRYTLTNKLTGSYFKTNEEIRPLFFSQLKLCGVEYFDYYLMHAQDKKSFEHFKKCHAYEEALKLKEEGYIKHVGLSFHDRVDVLKEILDTYPWVEVVQIQFNYLDMDSDIIQSRALYDLVTERNIPLIIMEPVKGGTLANLTDKAKEVLAKISDATPASFALRYVANFPNNKMILSGVSNISQMEDNIKTLDNPKPLTDVELKAIEEVKQIILKEKLIACTACQYCVDGCPKKINIPELFKLQNKASLNEWYSLGEAYQKAIESRGKASDCIKCGKCENICPQHLEIRALLEKVKKSFER